MLFKIQNLGAVKEAEIDLSKDLILLCGHNNTGKTYVAYAIGHILPIHRNYFYLTFKEITNIDKDNKTFLNINDELLDIAQKVIQKQAIIVDSEKLLTKFILPYKNQIIKKQLEPFNNYPRINSFFSTNHLEEIKFDIYFNIEHLKSKEIIFKKEVRKYLKKTYPIFFHKEPNSFELKIDFPNDIENEEKVKLDSRDFSSMIVYGEYSAGIANDICDCLISYFFENDAAYRIYLFPAERSAINIFSKELSLIQNKVLQASLKDKSLTELAERRLYRYPQPVRDSLELSQDLETFSKKQSEFAYLADELEQAILKGKISVGQYGDLRYSPAESPDLKLEMHVSSSLVKSLASISFYLRHIAQKGDCIIIDEPELNLHPDNQILVARFLARLVNEGFKVIASTHSDYIIRELNNLILLNNDFPEKKELIEKYNYQDNQLLASEKVGAYIFKDGYGKEVPLSNQGIEIQSIDTVIADLNQRSDDIYYSYLDSLPQEEE